MTGTLYTAGYIGQIRGSMSWFKRMSPGRPSGDAKASVPSGLWRLCAGCSASILAEDFERNLLVCPECGHHGRLGARLRLASFLDPDDVEELEAEMTPGDPLGFVDKKAYPERVRSAMEATEEREAFVLARGSLHGRPVVAGAFEFAFLGGSMGSVVGEKVAVAFETAAKDACAVVLFSASGGARMQEGIFSLMQMAKTTAALGRFRACKMPYVSVLCDPTTGGVAASFAMLGDIILAEPGALVGFAGPRVIEQTIRQKLPAGFQRSEFLLSHGVIDKIVPRPAIRDTVARIVGMLSEPA